MTNKEETFKQITEQMLDTYNKKNHDYGNSFEENCNEFGLVASVVRMSDKVNRIKALHKNPEISKVNEKLEDTLLDLANYAIMSVIWLRDKKV